VADKLREEPSQAKQPVAELGPEKQKPAADGWFSNAAPPAGKPAPAYSLDDLFLFDPTFESCW
jgi:hypothetical protein